jgi:hypothetical protein
MKLWEEADGDCWCMARVLEFGANTVLRGAAAERELFLTPLVVTVPIEEVSAGAPVRRIQRAWGFAHRAAAEAEDEAERARAAERAAASQPLEYFWRRMYHADRGAFLDAPADVLDAAAHIAAEAEEAKKSKARCMLTFADPAQSFPFADASAPLSSRALPDPRRGQGLPQGWHHLHSWRLPVRPLACAMLHCCAVLF